MGRGAPCSSSEMTSPHPLSALLASPDIYSYIQCDNGERTNSSISIAEKIGCPHEKEQNSTTILCHTQKLTQSGFQT